MKLWPQVITPQCLLYENTHRHIETFSSPLIDQAYFQEVNHHSVARLVENEQFLL